MPSDDILSFSIGQKLILFVHSKDLLNDRERPGSGTENSPWLLQGLESAQGSALAPSRVFWSLWFSSAMQPYRRVNGTFQNPQVNMIIALRWNLWVAARIRSSMQLRFSYRSLPLAFCSVMPQQEFPCHIRVACSLFFMYQKENKDLHGFWFFCFVLLFCTLRRKQQTGTEKPLLRNLFINYSFSDAQL